ncbi:unnamed protein product [Paramecium primaurelia]|uniref:Transmembrane protein n=1 Tax=Paramecium primaurelia TaxID=5886 RepID=A0A8S1P6M7_PARPR|nr:unnamed protein product [Paramecium primaurelia]
MVIHFLLINILKHTIFPILIFISFQILNETQAICILILPIYISFDILEQLIENDYVIDIDLKQNNILAPKLKFQGKCLMKDYQNLIYYYYELSRIYIQLNIRLQNNYAFSQQYLILIFNMMR